MELHFLERKLALKQSNVAPLSACRNAGSGDTLQPSPDRKQTTLRQMCLLPAGHYACIGILLIFFKFGHGKPPFLNASTGRQHSLLSPRGYCIDFTNQLFQSVLQKSDMLMEQVRHNRQSRLLRSATVSADALAGSRLCNRFYKML